MPRSLKKGPFVDEPLTEDEFFAQGGTPDKPLDGGGKDAGGSDDGGEQGRGARGEGEPPPGTDRSPPARAESADNRPPAAQAASAAISVTVAWPSTTPKASRRAWGRSITISHSRPNCCAGTPAGPRAPGPVGPKSRAIILTARGGVYCLSM